VEIIVDERDPEPPRPRLADDASVDVRVAVEGVDIRERPSRPAGTWNGQRPVGWLFCGDAVVLGLGDRVGAEPASTCRCRGSSGKHLHADAGKAST